MASRRDTVEAQWESYRKEIHTLYLGHSKPLKDVMAHMKEKHNFDATKAQYERHFKMWKLRKNLNNVEWKFVHHRMEKRKRDDKESVLWVDGIEIANKRVKKEISRHSRPLLQSAGQRYTSAPSPKTPAGISVLTPFEEIFFAFNPENLPWFQFQGFFESKVKINHGLVTTDAGGQVPGSGQQIFNSISPDQLSSSARANEMQVSTGISTPDFNSLFSGLSSIIAEPDIDIVDNISSRYSRIRTSLLAECPGGVGFMTFSEGSLEPTNRHILLRLINCAVYLASNNMLLDDHTDELLQWVINNKQESMLASLLSLKTPTTEAFADHIFGNAVKIEDMNVVRILLEGGSNPNRRAQSHQMPLGIAILKNNIELVRILLNAGADVNAPAAECDGRTALQAAADNGNIELVRILLNAGADVNAPAAGDFGRTALQAAADNRNIELVRILLNAGADVNAPAAEYDGRTALQAAAVKGEIELVRILLDAGADINAPAGYSRGITALQGAAINGHIGIALMLLKAGADVNAVAAMEDCRTALEGAAEHGRLDIVQLLLNFGADDEIVDGMRFESAAELAEKEGHYAIAKLLRNYSNE